MNKFVKAIMNLEGYDEEEAAKVHEECREEIMTAIKEGRYTEAEQMFEDYYGLEPDYLIDYL